MIYTHIVKSKNIYKESEKYIKSLFDTLREKTTGCLLLLSGGSVVTLYPGIATYITDHTWRAGSLAVAQVDERWRPGGGKPEEIGGLDGREGFGQMNWKNVNAEAIGETGMWKACQKRGVPYVRVSQELAFEEAVKQYETAIARLFSDYQNKIAILGIGRDGHTAGLLPGYQSAWDIDRLVAGYQHNGSFRMRITLTPRALRSLNQALVVATGTEKQEALRNVLNPAHMEKLDTYPGAVVHGMRLVDIFIENVL